MYNYYVMCFDGEGTEYPVKFLTLKRVPAT